MDAMKDIILSPIAIPDLVDMIASEVHGRLVDQSQIQQKDSLVTRQQLAKGDWSGGVSISIPTQHKYRRQGILKAVRIGAKVRFWESDLLDAVTKK